MALVQAKSDTRVWVDEDFDSSDISEDFVGRKALSLFQLKDLDVPVPPFIAISGSFYTEYVKECLGTGVDSSMSDEDVRKTIMDGAFELNARNELMEAYSRLSGFTDAWVSVRSSVILPHSHRDLTFAGLLGTVLNARGLDDVTRATREVYASAFTPKVAEYLSQNGLGISDIKVGIVVQKMVQAEASGIMFTIDPVTQDENYLTIEAVFGLGDVIASGEITPDQYTLEKKSLEFKEKKIVPQEWMMVRKLKKKAGEEGEQKVKISKSWQQQQKIENRYVTELSALALKIEKKFKEPQDIEWVFEGGRVWLLQTSIAVPVVIPADITEPVLAVEPAILDAVQDIVEKETARQEVKRKFAEKKVTPKKPAPKETPEKDAEVFVSKPLSRQVLDGTTKKKKLGKKRKQIVYSPLPGEKLLITGIGASQSSFRGEVVVIRNAKDLAEQKRNLDKAKVLVFSEFFPELEPYMTKVGAVISDTGGMTSDLSTRCRERNIPCVVGCHIASKMLYANESILVDGRIGAIYGIRSTADLENTAKRIEQKKQAQNKPLPKPTQQPALKQKETKDQHPKSDTSAIPPAPQEEPEAKLPSAPNIRTATDVFVDISDSYTRGTAWKQVVSESDGICHIDIGDLYKKIGRHPEAYIADGKKTELLKNLGDLISEICEEAGADPVILAIGNLTVSDYKSLTKGQSLEETSEVLNEGSRGLQRLLTHPKELSAFFAAVRRVRNVDGCRNLSIGVHYAGTPANLVEFKKLMSAANLRRSSTFKLYLLIDTPSEAMIIEDFVKGGIDGVIINTTDLARHMMASSTEDESVFKMIDTAKEATTGIPSILRIPGSADALLKRAVKKGFLGVAVPPKNVSDVRTAIAELERATILRT